MSSRAYTNCAASGPAEEFAARFYATFQLFYYMHLIIFSYLLTFLIYCLCITESVYDGDFSPTYLIRETVTIQYSKCRSSRDITEYNHELFY